MALAKLLGKMDGTTRGFPLSSPQPETIGHYRILRPLGTGGMGQVFLAEDTKLGRQVAIKLLPAEDSDQPMSRKRLIKEAQAAAKLDHPNVCAIHEVGEGDSGAYIVMQFVEGETLADLLQHRQPSTEEVARWGAQVADALDEAHRQGIVHRDIKPQNIMVTTKGQAKVLDFGLAKDVKALPVTVKSSTLLTSPGMVVGTVPYMSPEQVKGEDLDGRSDIFSLGAVLYEAATGRRPFTAKSGAELMSAILVAEPTLLLEDAEELHPELKRILRHCLAKEPADRYPIARALKQDLDRLHLGLLSGQHFPAESKARPRSWRPFAYAGLALLLAAGGVLGLRAWRAAAAPEETLAVLPFANTGRDPQVDYLADGLAEGLIDQLSKVHGLKVIAWTSASRFKGPNPDLKQLAKDLGVKAVLVGRILQRPDGLAVSVELADAEDGSHLWGDQFTRPVQDLMDLQDGIAKGVTRNLVPGATDAVPDGAPASPAYDLYLKGRFLADQQTPDSFKRALEMFDQALQANPKFAPAHAGKALAYWNASSLFMPSSEAMPKAKAEALAALDLDPRLSEARAALAQALFSYDRDYRGAEDQFQQAIALNPGSASAREYYGYFLMVLGREDEARAQLDQALKLDPLSSTTWVFKGGTYFYERDWPEAQANLSKALSIDAGHPVAELLLAWSADLRGDTGQADPHMANALKAGSPWVTGYQGYRLAKLGRAAEAQACLAQLQGPGLAYFRAMVLQGLGRREDALVELAHAVEDREEAVTTLKVDPTWDALRKDEAFQRLLAKAGLL